MQLERLSDLSLELMVNQINIQCLPIVTIGVLLNYFHLGSDSFIMLIF